jgi:hypothetical protein
MGMIGTILSSGLGAGGAVRQAGEAAAGVAEVFVGNEAEREAAAAKALQAAVGELGAEFAGAPAGRFDGFVDGLNRLPRPLLALSTIGLFGYAMAAPAGFSVRMQGLALVPEPLWWLAGAIVSFYFGARELHHQRTRKIAMGLAAARSAIAGGGAPVAGFAALAPQAAPVDPDRNAAVEEWKRLNGG